MAPVRQLPLLCLGGMVAAFAPDASRQGPMGPPPRTRVSRQPLMAEPGSWRSKQVRGARLIGFGGGTWFGNEAWEAAIKDKRAENVPISKYAADLKSAYDSSELKAQLLDLQREMATAKAPEVKRPDSSTSIGVKPLEAPALGDAKQKVAEIRAPDLDAAKDAVAKIKVPEPGAAKQFVPEVKVPEPAAVKQIVPEIKVPEPEAVKQFVPEVKVPEPAAVKQIVPEIKVPEPEAVKQFVPEVKVPEPAAMQQVAPEIQVPEPIASQVSEAVAPKENMPDFRMPDLNAFKDSVMDSLDSFKESLPDMKKMPGVGATEAKAPELEVVKKSVAESVQEFKAPQVKPPGIDAVKETVSDIRAQDMSAVEDSVKGNMPEITTPDVEAVKESVKKIMPDVKVTGVESRAPEIQMTDLETARQSAPDLQANLDNIRERFQEMKPVELKLPDNASPGPAAPCECTCPSKIQMSFHLGPERAWAAEGPDVEIVSARLASVEAPDLNGFKPPDLAVLFTSETSVVEPPDLSAVVSSDVSVIKPPDLSAVLAPEASVVKTPDLSALPTPDASGLKPPDLGAIKPSDLSGFKKGFRHADLSGVKKPDLSEFHKPDLSNFKQPDLSEFKKPDFSSFKGPDLSNFKQPDLSEFKKPDFSSFKGPDLSNFKQPDLSEFKKPDFSSFKGPDLSNFKQPDLSGFKGPDLSGFKPPDLSVMKPVTGGLGGLSVPKLPEGSTPDLSVLAAGTTSALDSAAHDFLAALGATTGELWAPLLCGAVGSFALGLCAERDGPLGQTARVFGGTLDLLIFSFLFIAIPTLETAFSVVSGAAVGLVLGVVLGPVTLLQGVGDLPRLRVRQRLEDFVSKPGNLYTSIYARTSVLGDSDSFGEPFAGGPRQEVEGYGAEAEGYGAQPEYGQGQPGRQSARPPYDEDGQGRSPPTPSPPGYAPPEPPVYSEVTMYPPPLASPPPPSRRNY